jgi:UPF0755 protein
VRRLLIVVVYVALLLGLGAGVGWWWVQRPLPVGEATRDFTVAPGSSSRSVAQAVVDAGVPVSADALYWWFRLSGQSRQIKAGSYEITPGTSPDTLLDKLVRGEQALRSVTLVEGWNFRQVREALAKAERLAPDSAALEPNAIMSKLGRAGVAAEGRFFPDTYRYPKNSSDLAVLKQAMQAMDKMLAAAWAQRQPDLMLKTPEEALIMASIVEKETGQGADRPLISGVFNNRLRIGMPLQTDPTVIYGLGASFDGNLRRSDLRADTPFNTYTRRGLPPTPIAMPGAASLLAAVQPARTEALYFVAKGDGSSHFSPSLEEHNRAVNQYQRNR